VTLRIQEVCKRYANGVQALQGLSLTIGPGMFGLLGPNGAGKSTLMRTVATLQPPDSGTIHFRDIDVLADPHRLRMELGYLPQEFGLSPTMSAQATLEHFATLKGIIDPHERRQVVDALLHKVNLYDVRRSAVGGYSGGMKQRLGIAMALAGTPQLVLVDEPTAGLDPSERNRFLNLLAEVGEQVVVILATHLVQDVRDLCTRMAIINGGRIVVQGSPEELTDEAFLLRLADGAAAS
jgi:ABC-type multidrug transport system ATPase subunit